MGGRGISSGMNGNSTGVSKELQAAWDKEEAELDALLKQKEGRIELGVVAYEKYTMKEMKDLLYGNFWDEYGVPQDTAVAILYKNGKTEYFGEGEEFRPSQGKSQIDSVIISAEYGYSVAGKNVKFENYTAYDVANDLKNANKKISLHNSRVEKGYEKGRKKRFKTQMTIADYGEYGDWRPDFK